MGETLTIDDLEETVTFPDLSATVTIPGFDYTAGLEAGSYILTGADVALARAYALGMDAGAYTLTGADSDLLHAALLSAEAGAYTLTGADADLIFGYAFALDAGSYTLTGAAAGLTHEALLGMNAGSFVLTGADVTLGKRYPLQIDAGTFTLTGADVSLYDPNTLSLLHFDGSDAATSVTDASIAGGHSWTFNGNAQLDTAQQKFGTASLLLDGTGDYIDAADSADWNTGSGDFTIDCWIRLNTTGTRQVVCGQINSGGVNANAANWIEVNASNVLQTYVGPTMSTLLAGSTALSSGTWYHVALVRSGDRYDLYLNGTSDANTTVSGAANNSAYKMSIGRLGEYNALYFNGWIDEWRFSNGVARWTTSFTPPTSAYNP